MERNVRRFHRGDRLAPAEIGLLQAGSNLTLETVSVSSLVSVDGSSLVAGSADYNPSVSGTLQLGGTDATGADVEADRRLSYGTIRT
jgi:hypothetical protein